jgi:inositol transport system permease protein
MFVENGYHCRPPFRAGWSGDCCACFDGQAGMGLGYELDAIAATVIGGTSLTGGICRIWGTVIGMVILGVMTSGFTFLGVDVYYQDIVKGVIIVAAVAADMYRLRKRKKL